MVDSQLPFNFRNELALDAGTDEGVMPGKAVTFQGVLVGVVSRSFADSATAQTVFDNGFRMPVRIGTAGIDALLQGGAYPEAMSITKSATIAAGDIIYAAALGLPYGIPVGIVASVSISPDNLFQQATVNFAYDVNDIQTVLVER